MADALLQDAVGRQANGVFDPFTFEIVVKIGVGEAGVASETDARDAAFVARHDRLEHALPAVGAMDVAGTKRTALQVAKLAFQTLFSCSPWVGLTLESMSRMTPLSGRRACTRSIHWPERWGAPTDFCPR